MKKTFLQNMKKIFVTAWVCGTIFLLIPYYSYSETSSGIWHDPPTCVIAGKAVRLSVEMSSTTSPKEVRGYFKKQGAASFYFIQMKQEQGNTYTGILPAPLESVSSVEYFILFVDRDDAVFKSQTFSVDVRDESACRDFRSIAKPTKLVVHAENKMSPEIGFSGEGVRWNVSGNLGKPYLHRAREIHVQPYISLSGTQKSKSSALQKLPFNKKTAIGLGVGVGAAVLLGVVLGGGDEPGEIWSSSVDDEVDDVVAEIYKIPQTQTSCGTIVTNELFVTNNRTGDVVIGIIDYEVVLTKDNPSGACNGGKIGTFAPNWANTLRPGERALIRTWSNEVNPCSNCPYLIADCQWDSRYVVHTSVGSAIAETTFSAQGDLCSTSSAKLRDNGVPICGDIEP